MRSLKKLMNSERNTMIKHRVVVDSNVWISHLLNKELSQFVQKVQDADLNVFTRQELTDELTGVLKRNKFKKYVSKNDIQEFIAIHLKLCQLVKLDDIPDILTDKKDNFLIALCKTAKASILVTGDKQLIKEARENNINAITTAQFKQLTSQS